MLDEVRIYDVALAYSEVMDDRFGCFPEPGLQSEDLLIQAEYLCHPVLYHQVL